MRRPGDIGISECIGKNQTFPGLLVVLAAGKDRGYDRPYAAIFIYLDTAHAVIRMYVIIRCPGGCRTFTYVDRFQKWKLCPLCGHAYEVAKAPAYLEVDDHHEAEHIIKQMERHLHTHKKKDFSAEETAELRHHYTAALRRKKQGAAH